MYFSIFRSLLEFKILKINENYKLYILLIFHCSVKLYFKAFLAFLENVI